MIRNSREKLIEQLSGEGIVFSTSVKMLSGAYQPEDADWNYRDIPHLNFIHSQVEGALALASDDFLSSILVQKVGPFKIVLTVVLISEVDKGQFYYTSVGPVVLLIDTSWESLNRIETKVTTRYSVGTPRFLKFLQPLVHKVLARNYEILMSEDTPMRLQRGKLRARGFSFRQDEEGHSYSDSIQIAKNNLRQPELPAAQIKINLTSYDGKPNEYWDEAGIRSVVVHRSAGDVFISRSICPHEGAALDGANCKDDHLECPWHGRLIKPWAKVNLETGDSLIEEKSEIEQVTVEGNQLTIRLLTQGAN